MIFFNSYNVRDNAVMYLWGVSIVKKQIIIKKDWNIKWFGLFLKRKWKIQLDWTEYVTALKYMCLVGLVLSASALSY